MMSRAGATMLELLVVLVLTGILLAASALQWHRGNRSGVGVGADTTIAALRRRAALTGNAESAFVEDSEKGHWVRALPDGRLLGDGPNILGDVEHPNGPR